MTARGSMGELCSVTSIHRPLPWMHLMPHPHGHSNRMSSHTCHALITALITSLTTLMRSVVGRWRRVQAVTRPTSTRCCLLSSYLAGVHSPSTTPSQVNARAQPSCLAAACPPQALCFPVLPASLFLTVPPPLGGKEVIVSRKCGEAVLRGAPIYVPGVLACSPGIERGDLVAVSVVLERPGR